MIVEKWQKTKRRRMNREILEFFCVFALILSLLFLIATYFGQTRGNRLGNY